MGFEVTVVQFLQRWRGFGVFELMWFVSEIGRAPLILLIIVAVALGLFYSRLYRELLVLIFSTGAVSAFGWWLKYLINRPRPSLGQALIYRENLDPSFPSGHVLVYVVFFGFLFYIATQKLKSPVIRIIVQCFLGGLILFVGLSRVYLGEHWPLDVGAAYLLGFIWLRLTVSIHKSALF